MKKLFVTVLVLLVAVPAMAIEWKEATIEYAYEAIFDSAAGCHGVAVDKYGRVWSANYYDPIRIMDADGNLVATIDSLLVPGLGEGGAAGWRKTNTNARGIEVDLNGNMVYANGGWVININVDSYDVIAAYPMPAGSVAGPAIDADGFIYVGQVVGANPILVIDPADYSLAGQYQLTNVPGYTRDLQVSDDGSAIYMGDISGSKDGIQVHTTEDYITYVNTDSLFVDVDGDTIFSAQKTALDWDPMGRLWVSMDDAYAAVGAPQLVNALVVFDFSTEQYGYVWMPDPGEDKYNGPRGVAFSEDGETAYVGGFNGNVVYKYVKTAMGPVSEWKEVPSGWEYVAIFDSSHGSHGVAVDKYDRLWSANYYDPIRIIDAEGNLVKTIDSLLVPGAGADGSAAWLATNTNARGIEVDPNGNIVYCRGGRLINIDVDTYEVLAAYAMPAGSVAGVGIDSEGFIYTGQVVGTNPILVIDPADYSLAAQYTLTNVPSYTRDIQVNSDGSAIYVGDIGDNSNPIKIHTTTDYITYQYTDSLYSDNKGKLIFKTMKTALDWDRDGKLWISQDAAYAPAGPDQKINSLVAFDFEKKEYSYTMMPDPGESNYTGPRGVAFSQDGNTAYSGVYNGYVIYKFVYNPVSVRDRETLPIDFELGQNYPNPFNPTTTIPFTLKNDGSVELTVFDITGRQVAKLVDDQMTAGSHSVTFDATMQATGMYYYRLNVNGQMLTKKMLFVK
ncbi:MAG TPA: T9SS type A sorting domain-containing protein [bacterium]|nr:T9SS type A sorting domain-containing protein [bacterium]HPG44104.1 T9SS type A sorting domain-containing protein [bacterium]HPM96470.1 T9SS type A sorting domain-containing protein [bacterium]